MSAALGALGLAALAGGSWMLVTALARARAGQRLGGADDRPAAQRRTDVLDTALRRWLASAGRSDAGAARRFVAAQLAAIVAGIACAAAAAWLAEAVGLAALAASLPVFGAAAAALSQALPLAVGACVASAPALATRRERRRRAEAIEEDLPLALELLAALSEAGLGFDAALARLLDAQLAERPLASELRVLQRDAAAGARRVDSLRRFGARVDRPVVRSVVDALVQAEEVGSGIAEVLRPLADDQRAQRRERALARAEALPDKLVVALVLGFLPGLLYWTLGPSLLQLVTLLDGIQLR